MENHFSIFDYSIDFSSCQADFEYNQKKLIAHMRDKEKILPLVAQAAQKLGRPDSFLQNIIECGTLLSINENDEITQGNFCHARLCPVCAWKRSLKLYHNVKNIVECINSNENKIRYLFVTVTQPNVSSANLDSEINRIMYGFKKFRQFSAIRKATLGAIKTMEVTYNAEKNTYHPHLHIIFAVPARYFKKGDSLYLTASEISALWAKAINSEVPLNTDIKAIKKGGEEGAIAEVCKYAVKLSSVAETNNAVAFAEVMRAIHGRRLFTYSGVFRKYAKFLNIALDVDEAPDVVTEGRNFRIWKGNTYKKVDRSQWVNEVWSAEMINKKEIVKGMV